ncbi:dynamin-related protein 5A [Cinnamomum micranthum f. kanehirae]|uniref:Dynamin-related protein 5A n=1 Tax=Cinnamomum micranthum f. kanehirae TaxID=337451 RepID=A0A443PZN8_9MAGN|nr:dynamin-related protein 5A [Cinnamomum micranthum f. kanehirae]
MASNTFHTTPVKTPNSKSLSSSMSSRKTHQSLPTDPSSNHSDFKSRFEAYNRLQAAAVAFGEKLPIPEIVAVGGQSDGKSSLLEALLGFRFNVREVEMGTRRPLILQMVHDASAFDPRCRFQEEDSEEYGSPIVSASTIADLIKYRTDALLKKTRTAVSPKPIVMRVEYAHCPNLTIIDTPGFVLKAKKGEPEGTPDEIMSMVKSLASPPHRLLLFLQQSSVEWCSSLWLDAIREIDPSFRRTIIVVSKFDNRLKEFSDRWEVDRYLSASGYLGDNTHPYFVALPKDRGTISNEEFRRQISQVDAEVLRHLRDSISGGFDEEKFGPFIGFGCLRDFLESELQKKYKEAAPSTLALLEQRCGEVTAELAHVESKLQATSDVVHLRRSAMLHAASISSQVGALIEGAADPDPEQWGKTTAEEQLESGAFERVIHEFRFAAYSIECPEVSREKVANILLAHAGRGGGRGVVEAAAEIARAAARSWFSPLLDTACDRLAFVLRGLFDLAMERNQSHDSSYGRKNGNMDGYIGFHAALRRSYNNFIQDLSKQCKQLIRHHLDSVTSPYSQMVLQFNTQQVRIKRICHQINHNTPHLGKEQKPKKPFEDSNMTVPETPSPDQPSDIVYGAKEKGKCNDIGRRRHARILANSRNAEHYQHQNGSLLFGGGDIGLRSGSAYSDICSSAAQHFSKIREVLIERSVLSTLNSGFLTPCRDRLVVALGLDLFAVNDEIFMDMFVAPGAVDVLQTERLSLHKRQKILHSCLTEFKTIARAL